MLSRRICASFGRYRRWGNCNRPERRYNGVARGTIKPVFRERGSRPSCGSRVSTVRLFCFVLVAVRGTRSEVASSFTQPLQIHDDLQPPSFKEVVDPRPTPTFRFSEV